MYDNPRQNLDKQNRPPKPQPFYTKEQLLLLVVPPADRLRNCLNTLPLPSCTCTSVNNPAPLLCDAVRCRKRRHMCPSNPAMSSFLLKASFNFFPLHLASHHFYDLQFFFNARAESIAFLLKLRWSINSRHHAYPNSQSYPPDGPLQLEGQGRRGMYLLVPFLLFHTSLNLRSLPIPTQAMTDTDARRSPAHPVPEEWALKPHVGAQKWVPTSQ